MPATEFLCRPRSIINSALPGATTPSGQRSRYPLTSGKESYPQNHDVVLNALE